MPKSDRDPAVLAAEREARLAARMAKEYLRSGAVEDALSYLQQVLSDPKCPTRTKVQAAKTLAVNAAKISSKRTQLDLSAQTVTMNMADLLAMAQEVPELPNTGEVVVPAIQAGGVEGVETFTVTERGDHPLSQRVADDARQGAPGAVEATEDHGSPSASETPAGAARSNEDKEDPTEGLGDTSPPKGDPS